MNKTFLISFFKYYFTCFFFIHTTKVSFFSFLDVLLHSFLLGPGTFLNLQQTYRPFVDAINCQVSIYLYIWSYEGWCLCQDVLSTRSLRAHGSFLDARANMHRKNKTIFCIHSSSTQHFIAMQNNCASRGSITSNL